MRVGHPKQIVSPKFVSKQFVTKQIVVKMWQSFWRANLCLWGEKVCLQKSCGKPFLVQNLDVALDPCLVLRQPFNNLETHL